MTENRNKESKLRELEKVESLIQRVMEGEKISCNKCGYELTFKGPNSGAHPGVYCGAGCTEIFIEMRNK